MTLVDHITADLAYLARCGSRLTGAPAHRSLVGYVTERFEKIGYHVQRELRPFRRWFIDQPNAVSLYINGTAISISSVYPYSGTTNTDGIVGPLVSVTGLKKKWAAARNAIAVVRVPHIAFPGKYFFTAWDDTSLPAVQHPVVSAEIFARDLSAAKHAGVKAVIFVWEGLSATDAADQYVPFTQDYCDIPALWVADESAHAVIQACKQNVSAQLVIQASWEEAVSESIWVESPGEINDETILFITHSDGTNQVEENGFVALLHLAEQAAQRAHKRRFIFLLLSGHFRFPAVTSHGQAAHGWLARHRHYWAGGKNQAHAVCGCVMEHLGARQNKTSSAEAPTVLYATTTPLYQSLQNIWSNLSDAYVVSPSALRHFGEGEALFDNGIPAISFITAPTYLLAETQAPVCDEIQARRHITDFVNLMWHLDNLTDPGRVKQFSAWEKSWARMRVLLSLMRSQISQ